MLSTRSRRGKRGGRSRIVANQGELAFRAWGGARRGAGRKPKGERALIPHDARPAHVERYPLLITTRLLPGLQSLRRAEEAALIRAALARTNECAVARAAALAAAGAEALANETTDPGQQARGNGRRPARAKGSAPFQVVHHSIQSNHLHLIVEAGDRNELTAGMRGLLVRIARTLNRLWGRRGSVFADRFHERVLASPRQVRNALVYVLQNLRKHGIAMREPDPFSSGPEFEGWSGPPTQGRREAGREGSSGTLTVSADGARIRGRAWIRAESSRDVSRNRAPGIRGSTEAPGHASLARAARTAIPSPRTWLLGVGWQRHGLIEFRECPRPL
jgi:hypothetical protein